jgi:hypothetical protein
VVNKEYKQFYWFTLAVLLVLSAYPLINGVHMAYLSIANGAIEPEQYAKYVVPYAAMCTAAILFAVFQPLLYRIKRRSFTIGLIGTYAVFAAVEQFFERIQIHTASMTLVDPTTLSVSSTTIVPPAAADAWQAALCIVSPLTRGQSVAYASQDRYFYVMANDTYKIHYYLISFILITMVCGLVYGIGHMIRTGDIDRKKPLILQGMVTAAFVALCVFANTTAFFRQSQAIQTPLASVLTCLFFIILGAAIGVYAGSFLLRKSKSLGLGVPALLTAACVLLMYIGEAVMMEGGLYRFGTGLFFENLPGIPLAPVDILVVLFSILLTLTVLNLTRQRKNWPDKRTAVITFLLCILLTSTGIAYSMPQAKSSSSNILGCYEFDECLYMNPLSSFLPVKGFMPYVYGLGEDTMIIANTKTGDVQRLTAQYENSTVAGDEFSSKSSFPSFSTPDVSQYKERRLRAVLTGEGGQQYNLYQMDGEIWLVMLSGRENEIWSIYRLQPTDQFTFSELEKALEIHYNETNDKKQMNLRDVYEFAKKGKNLTQSDFEAFSSKAAGSGFTILRYDIEGGCVLIVHADTPDSAINYAHLSKQGYDPFDETLTVDIRDGAQAVAAYLDPLHSLAKLKLEDPHSGIGERELIYEFDGYRYFLNTRRADQVYINFENGDRLPLKQALEERRTVVEDLVANGLFNVYMEPVENPTGGYFTILHHPHKFSFNNEAFYPSASFMYVDTDDLSAYFDIAELAVILELQGRDEVAERLRTIKNSSNLSIIADKTYIKNSGFAEAGIAVDIGWAYSSHTPVRFTSANR